MMADLPLAVRISQADDFLAWACVPNSQRAVAAAGRKTLAVRAEGQANDRARVAAECQLLALAVKVPNDDGLVTARRGKAPTIGAECQVGDLSSMSAEDGDFPAGLCLPDGHGIGP